MAVELINTGTELLLGRVLNTHQQWLGRELADLGYQVSRQVAVPDNGPAIVQALQESLARARLIVVTGGLGPTSDDITRDLVAQLLGRKLIEDKPTLARIIEFFATRKRPMPASTKVQALIPEGALILTNEFGTAPGLALEISPNILHAHSQPCWLIMLPGPPRELRPMFTNHVVPLLRSRVRGATSFVCRTLKTTGIGESVVEEKIKEPLMSLVERGLEIGYCARTGEVDVRLASSREDAPAVVGQAFDIVRGLLAKNIYGSDDDLLEHVIVRLLTKRRETLALAESCTGGTLANRITNVPGASAVLLEGVVAYSNASKERLLGVPPELLSQQGSVSDATARAMAEGCRQRSGADYALSVTGIAGPGGGSEAKPVGTVFMGLATRRHTVVLPQLNRYDRETFKFVTSQQALELLRRALVS